MNDEALGKEADGGGRAESRRADAWLVRPFERPDLPGKLPNEAGRNHTRVTLATSRAFRARLWGPADGSMDRPFL